MDSRLLIVVGLAREAGIAARWGRVVIGAASVERALEGAAGLVSFGLCGALDPTLKAADLVVADAVVAGEALWATDAAWTAQLRARLPSAHGGSVAAGATIVGSASAKAALRAETGAVCVDMESHEAALAARRAGLPFAVVRAVSDAAATSLPPSAQAGFRADGVPDVASVLAALLRRPWELPALVRTGMDAEAAFRTLRRAAPALALASR